LGRDGEISIPVRGEGSKMKRKFTGTYHEETVTAPLVDPLDDLCNRPVMPQGDWYTKAADAYLRAKTFSNNKDSAFGVLRFEGCDPIAVAMRADEILTYTVDCTSSEDFPSAFLAAWAMGQGMDINDVWRFTRFVKAMVKA